MSSEKPTDEGKNKADPKKADIRVQQSIEVGKIESGGSVTGVKTGDVYGSLTVVNQFGLAINYSFLTYEPPEPPKQGELAEAQDILPPGSRVPFPRNRVFTGRENELLKLSEALVYGESEQRLIVTQASAVARGYGGIGKSQLANEFCYRYGRFFNGVHWIQANQDIPAEIALCGLEMGLQPWPEELQDQVTTTLRVWEQTGPRLVVLDNAEDPEILQKWLPRMRTARVLITARRQEWPADLGLAVCELQTLSRAESLTLLRRLAPRLEKAPDEELDRIAERMGDFPLALDLAGRHFQSRKRLMVDGFLSELDQAGNDLQHTALRDWVKYNPVGHSTSLEETFLLSWKQLQNELEQEIFRMCGFCEPNTPIPWIIWEEAWKDDRVAAVDLDLAMKRLGELGLAVINEAGPSLHPLLALFGQLLEQEREQPSALNRLFDALNRSVSIICRDLSFPHVRLEPHIKAAAENLRKDHSQQAMIQVIGLNMMLKNLEYRTMRQIAAIDFNKMNEIMKRIR